MDVRGDYTFTAERALLWDTMTDVEVTKRALPGCQEFREVSPENYRVTLKVNVIAFDVTVSGDVVITDLKRPDSYRVLVSGSGSAGTLKADVRLVLTEKGTGSLLNYHLNLQLTGALALLGIAMIDPAVKMIMNQFLGSIEKELAAITPAAAQ